ncbi:MAG: HEAT repeat domain-containing protein [Planctomycetota bacterium]
MRNALTILLGLAVVAAVHADGGTDTSPASTSETAATDEPLIIFSTPDKESSRTISELVKKLKAGTRSERRERRAGLLSYGPWATTRLADALAGRRADGSNVARMGAAICITEIGDKSGLSALRLALDDEDRWVRKTATLALGRFALPEDGQRLESIAKEDSAPAAYFALAKLPDVAAPMDRLQRTAPKRGAKHDARAAHLLANAVVSPIGKEVWEPCVAALKDDEKLIRRVAAVGLLLRPDAILKTEVILDAAEKHDDDVVRATLQLTLGRLPRTDKIANALLATAVSSRVKKSVRARAALALAGGWFPKGAYKKLNQEFGRIKGNDPRVISILHAMACAGEDEGKAKNTNAAIDRLLSLKRSNSWTRKGVACALAHTIYVRPAGRHKREPEIQDALIELRSKNKDERFVRFLKSLLKARNEYDNPVRRRELALEAFREHGYSQLLPLEEQALRAANLAMRVVLKLDDLSDFETAGGSVSHGEQETVTKDGSTEDTGQFGGKGGGGSEEEADLIDFLRGGYFVPGDVRGS